MTRAVLLVLLVTWSVVIPIYWISWFRNTPDLSARPVGYREHEEAFLWPDAVLTALLATSGALVVGDSDTGFDVALVAGGMMLFLGLLDLAYDVRNGVAGAAASRLRPLAEDLAIAVSAVAVIGLALSSAP